MKKTIITLLLLKSLFANASANLIIDCPNSMISLSDVYMSTTIDNPEQFEVFKTKYEIIETSNSLKIISERRTISLNNNGSIRPSDCQVNFDKFYLIKNPLKLVDLSKDSTLKENTLYSVLDSHQSLDKGVLMIFVGESNGLEGKSFRNRLKTHVDLVAKTMGPYGQLKYYVYSSGDKEFALIQWPSKSAMEFAFTKVGSTVWNDADEFLTGLVWKEVPHEKIPLRITKGFIEREISRADIIK